MKKTSLYSQLYVYTLNLISYLSVVPWKGNFENGHAKHRICENNCPNNCCPYLCVHTCVSDCNCVCSCGCGCVGACEWVLEIYIDIESL